MLNNLFSSLGNRTSRGQWGTFNQSRIIKYFRYKKMYDGLIVRTDLASQKQWKPLRYNLSVPIIDISADFLAAKPITFTVTDEEEISAVCDKIWTESGGSSTFHENALLGGITGDACVIISKSSDQETACIKWLDPAICYPEFDAHDYTKMVALDIIYTIKGPDGNGQKYREEWRGGTVNCYTEDKLTETYTYDEEAYGGVPAVWIRNLGVKGEVFGRSDLHGVVDLIENYDHKMEKQDRIIDYYASPNIYAKGVKANQLEISKGERTVYFLPTDGEIGFIEWKGAPPGIAEHIAKIRETISEVSETPEVAFSKVGTGLSTISGVALKILYGPLIHKTNRKRMTWGPALERAMQMALIAEGYTDIELDQISIEWQDPLPENLVESWQIAAQEEALGVTTRQILKERGYTDDQVDEFEKEKAEKESEAQAQMMKSFAQGTSPTNPYPQGQDVPPNQKPQQPPQPPKK